MINIHLVSSYIQQLNFLDFGVLFGVMEKSLFGLLLDIRQGGNTASPVTFPIRFPTTCLNVVPIIQTTDTSNIGKDRVLITTLSNTGFAIKYPQGTYRYYAVGY